MHPTKNDLPLANRKKISTILEQLLADSIDLYLQTKQAHWNVQAANFIALHELFDTLATEVSLDVDTIAERLRQLGADASGDIRGAAKKSRLKPYPLLVADGFKHASALASALAGFNHHGRQAIDAVDDLGDAITADIITGIVRGLDKQLWFVEAHIH